jgi:DNA-binding PucR family transcriptional regulator
VLAEHVPADAIAAVPDVQALDRLAAPRGGPDVIATLHAICVHDSIRHAATAMHLHHSSVVARLERAEDELGFSVRSPGRRTRLVLALTLRHLR